MASIDRVTIGRVRRARSASRVRRATSLRMAQFTPKTASARRPAPTTEKASHAQVRGSTPCGATSTRTHSSRIRCTSSGGISRRRGVEQALDLGQVRTGGERELVGEAHVAQDAEPLHPGGGDDPGEARQVHHRSVGGAREEKPEGVGVVGRRDQLEPRVVRAEEPLHRVPAPHGNPRAGHGLDAIGTAAALADHQHGGRREVGACEEQEALPFRSPHEEGSRSISPRRACSRSTERSPVEVTCSRRPVRCSSSRR